MTEDRVQETEEKWIRVVMLQPGKLARVEEIDASLEGMQQIVGGLIEPFYPFEEQVCIICNEEGKMNGMPLNRAVYAEPEEVEMSYTDMKNLFHRVRTKENTLPAMLFSVRKALLSHTRSSPEPTLFPATTKPTSPAWVDTPSTDTVWMEPILAFVLSSIWPSSTAARTAGRSNAAI